METVLSDRMGDKVKFLREAQAAGYAVVFLWIRLSDPELCAARVAQRVARGGHDVPAEKLEARFARTVHNAVQALAFADIGAIIDNSSLDAPFHLIEWWEHGQRIK